MRKGAVRFECFFKKLFSILSPACPGLINKLENKIRNQALPCVIYLSCNELSTSLTSLDKSIPVPLIAPCFHALCNCCHSHLIRVPRETVSFANSHWVVPSQQYHAVDYGSRKSVHCCACSPCLPDLSLSRLFLLSRLEREIAVL